MTKTRKYKHGGAQEGNTAFVRGEREQECEQEDNEHKHQQEDYEHERQLA